MEDSETKDNALDEAGSGTTPTPEAPATPEAPEETLVPAAPEAPEAAKAPEGTPTLATSDAPQTMEEEVLIRKKKRHHSRRKKILKRVAIVVGILVAIAVVIAIAAFAFMKSGESAVKQANTADNIQADDSAVTYDEGRTVEYNGKTYALNENMVSVAVIGYDRQTEEVVPGKSVGQADAIMVLAVNLDTGKTTGIGIPRDSMVEVGEFMGDTFTGMSTMQLCLAYAYGDGGELSSQYTASAVSRVLYNMPVSYYFSLDMDGVGALADAIGGVSLTPTQSIPNTNIVEGEPTVLFGSNALKYVQWRDTSVLTSSLDRQTRQSQFVETFCKQALSSAQGNVGTLVNLYTTASNYAVTNLGLNEFSYLASSVLATGITSVDMTTLQGTMQQGGKFAEFYLDKTNVYETVLNVYYHEVGSEK